MAQHRDAPAFQEYAASMMARTAYRVMSLEARGLLYSMRLECWVNGSVPANAATLARVLGFESEQVARALPELAEFFAPDGGTLRCRELDLYRAHLEDRQARQSAGGKAGAAITNRGRQQRASGGATGHPRVGRESLVKLSSVQSSKAKSLEGEASTDEWLSEYERASGGQ